MTDQLFANRYKLERILGSGSFGTVYLAQDTRLGNREVALKILHSGPLIDPSPLQHSQHFDREISVQANLRHDNIVKLNSAGAWERGRYLDMEFINGPSLAQVVKEQGAQPPERVVVWLIQAASALAYAHEQGIIHRDIKAANLILDTKLGRIYVSDFGLAQAVENNDGMGTLTREPTAGTAAYRAPEVRETGHTVASDLYSLGVVAYELLTGQRPFIDKDPAYLLLAHVNDPVPPLSDSQPTWLAAIILRLLSKNPEDRYRTASDLIAAVSTENCQSGQPVSQTKQPQQEDPGVRLNFVPQIAVANRSVSQIGSTLPVLGKKLFSYSKRLFRWVFGVGANLIILSLATVTLLPPIILAEILLVIPMLAIGFGQFTDAASIVSAPIYLYGSAGLLGATLLVSLLGYLSDICPPGLSVSAIMSISITIGVAVVLPEISAGNAVIDTLLFIIFFLAIGLSGGMTTASLDSYSSGITDGLSKVPLAIWISFLTALITLVAALVTYFLLTYVNRIFAWPVGSDSVIPWSIVYGVTILVSLFAAGVAGTEMADSWDLDLGILVLFVVVLFILIAIIAASSPSNVLGMLVTVGIAILLSAFLSAITEEMLKKKKSSTWLEVSSGVALFLSSSFLVWYCFLNGWRMFA